MNKLILLISFLIASSSYGQSDRVYYKNIVDNCFTEFKEKMSEAWKNGNEDDAEKYIDELVDTCLNGKYLSNYNFKSLKGKIIKTDEIKKPILIITSATWCGQCWGEIPALNKIAKKHKKDLQILVLFWDQKEKLTKMGSKYNEHIYLIPSESNQEDKSSTTISGFIHKLHFPAAYLIDKDKKILDLSIGAVSPSKTVSWEEATKANEKKLMEFINPILN